MSTPNPTPSPRPSTRLRIPSHHTTLSPPLQSDLLSALVASPGSISRIQDTLHSSLEASGWTTNLRAYVQYLLRSGECATYNEVMKRVMEEVRSGGAGGDDEGAAAGSNSRAGTRKKDEGRGAKGGKKGAAMLVKERERARANGNGGGEDGSGDKGGSNEAGEGMAVRSVEDGGVRLPEAAMRDGVKAVRKELDEICEVVFEDE